MGFSLTTCSCRSLLLIFPFSHSTSPHISSSSSSSAMYTLRIIFYRAIGYPFLLRQELTRGRKVGQKWKVCRKAVTMAVSEGRVGEGICWGGAESGWAIIGKYYSAGYHVFVCTIDSTLVDCNSTKVFLYPVYLYG